MTNNILKLLSLFEKAAFYVYQKVTRKLCVLKYKHSLSFHLKNKFLCIGNWGIAMEYKEKIIMIKQLLHFRVIVLNILLLYSGTIVAEDFGKEQKPLTISPSELSIKVGKTSKFGVRCMPEKNAKVEDQCSWFVLPDSLGAFHGPEFSALKSGDGIIVASYKEYADTIKVEVLSGEDKHEGDDTEKGKDHKYPMITFENGNWLKLSVGESSAIHPVYWLSKDSSEDVNFTYNLRPAIMGNVSEDGIFTAEYPGNGVVTVQYEMVKADIKIQVKRNHKNTDDNYPLLDIVTSKMNIKSGEFAELMAAYFDSTGSKKEIAPEWTVNPSNLGHFSDSIFYADSVGKGYIIATCNGLIDSIPLNVQEPREDDDDNIWSNFRILIQPNDTTISVGDSIQYSLSVQNKNNRHMVIDSTMLDSIDVKWTLIGNDVGEISNEGLLTAQQRGFAVVKATLNNEKAITTRVIVKMANADTTGQNIVDIQRVLPNGNILPSKTISEGDSYKITGLPYPLNVLNGGLLNFPEGSLHEDISIYMLLPEQIKEDSSDVVAEDSVIAGIKFVVSINDSIFEPYYFDTPLILSIPFKTEILDSLGIDPEQIGVFFAQDGDYTNSGITNVVIDTIDNRIIAEVEHFSSIVLRRDYTEQQTKVKALTALPRGEIINKPNPFVSSTSFEFELKETMRIELIIYNVHGQAVKQFSLGKLNEGNHVIVWDGTNRNGSPVQPGLYFGAFMENGKRIKVSKIIKLGL